MTVSKIRFGTIFRTTNHIILSLAVPFAPEYYQLEEMEDRDSCTTELFLRADGVVEFGDTDGPQFIAAAGTWSVPLGTNDYNSKSR